MSELQTESNRLWQKLEPKVNYLDNQGKELVNLAFTQMVLSHSDQKRKSGEFYIAHPVAACIILAELKLPADTLAACLMHDVPEDTETTFEQLAEDFAPEIIFLIQGVTKFGVFKYQGEERYAENLRKMFVAMSRDIRIIFIKLADRIHNLQTLQHVRRDKQYRIALESLEIYAPIAERLGISKFRGTIEDLAFPYVYPEEHERLLQKTELEIDRRQKLADKTLKAVEETLIEKQIPYELVEGRAKRYYSIYKKTLEKNRKLSEIYDLIALRIITFDVEQCYQILSEVHQMFEPLKDRVKDYVQKPKENGYQSIHTTVRDPDTKHVFEFQIRTKQMHEYAEFGIATHWSYKDNVDKNKVKSVNPKQAKWINELVKLGDKKLKEEEYLRKVKINIYHDRIFVMTPKGDVIDLRQGATALDFAFKVHEEIGNKAVLALINGTKAKLKEKLKNGDVVEIITNKNQHPTRDWLNRVSTGQATHKIKRWLSRNRE